MGVMMAKKFRERRAVFQFRRAWRMEILEKWSASGAEVEWESRAMRRTARDCSEVVRKWECEVVWGR